jgi:uncharacterized protein YjiS (DUF1127 family)
MTGNFKDAAVPIMVAVFSAAAGSVVTVVFAPLAKRVWRAYRRWRFDPKEAHYKELIEEGKWFDSRAAKLAVFRQQLVLNPPTDRYRLAELISKLDKRDAEWVRKVDDVSVLLDATTKKQEECLNDAQECAELADELEKKIFW